MLNETKQSPKEAIKYQGKGKFITDCAENKQVTTHPDLNSINSKQSSPPKQVQQRKQYYSSSSDVEIDSSASRIKPKKMKLKCASKTRANSENANFLTKLESFDSFWQDEPK